MSVNSLFITVSKDTKTHLQLPLTDIGSAKENETEIFKIVTLIKLITFLKDGN